MSMNGMYYIKFAGSAGEGIGTLTFKDGLIYGFDEGGGIYDGTYAQMPDDPSMVSIKVSVKMPAGQPSVVGGINQPFDWTLPVETEMPINSASGDLRVRTQLGHTVHATYQRMRSLPLAA